MKKKKKFCKFAVLDGWSMTITCLKPCEIKDGKPVLRDIPIIPCKGYDWVCRK